MGLSIMRSNTCFWEQQVDNFFNRYPLLKTNGKYFVLSIRIAERIIIFIQFDNIYQHCLHNNIGS